MITARPCLPYIPAVTACQADLAAQGTATQLRKGPVSDGGRSMAETAIAGVFEICLTATWMELWGLQAPGLLPRLAMIDVARRGKCAGRKRTRRFQCSAGKEAGRPEWRPAVCGAARATPAADPGLPLHGTWGQRKGPRIRSRRMRGSSRSAGVATPRLPRAVLRGPVLRRPVLRGPAAVTSWLTLPLRTAARAWPPGPRGR
jgi:hypothetical protein